MEAGKSARGTLLGEDERWWWWENWVREREAAAVAGEHELRALGEVPWYSFPGDAKAVLAMRSTSNCGWCGWA
jgi:hypothetical protein